LKSITLDDFLKQYRATTAQYAKHINMPWVGNKPVTLVTTNCTIPGFRQFVFSGEKSDIEKGYPYGFFINVIGGVVFTGMGTPRMVPWYRCFAAGQPVIDTGRHWPQHRPGVTCLPLPCSSGPLLGKRPIIGGYS